MAYETLFDKPRGIIGVQRVLNGCSACGMGEDYDPFVAMARSAAEAAQQEMDQAVATGTAEAANAQVNYQAAAGDPNSPAGAFAAAAARAAAQQAGGGGGGLGGVVMPLLLAAGAVLLFWGTVGKKPRKNPSNRARKVSAPHQQWKLTKAQRAKRRAMSAAERYDYDQHRLYRWVER